MFGVSKLDESNPLQLPVQQDAREYTLTQAQVEF